MDEETDAGQVTCTLGRCHLSESDARLHALDSCTAAPGVGPMAAPPGTAPLKPAAPRARRRCTRGALRAHRPLPSAPSQPPPSAPCRQRGDGAKDKPRAPGNLSSCPEGALASPLSSTPCAARLCTRCPSQGGLPTGAGCRPRHSSLAALRGSWHPNAVQQRNLYGSPCPHVRDRSPSRLPKAAREPAWQPRHGSAEV